MTAGLVDNPRLVGRAAELGLLGGELGRARAGWARSVLLVAESGIGKTRLVSEFIARQRGSALDLRARAYPLGRTAALGVWAEALEPALRGVDAGTLRSLCGGFVDDLASLLRSVAAVRGSIPSRPPRRQRLLEGIAVLVRNLAAQQPLLIFIDDAHLADATSWHVVNYLLRTGRGSRLLIVATVRPGELADNRLATDIVLSLEQDGMLRRLDLPPLPRDKVAQLAGELRGGKAAPEPLVDWLWTRSQGYPLFVIGLLRALIDAGGDTSNPNLARIPGTLRERVVARFQRLDGSCRGILDELAVVGRGIELEELARLGGRPPGQTNIHLEHLVRSRLVLEETRGPALRFCISHPLVQDAVYEWMEGTRRRMLHRRVARGLQRSGLLAAAAPHFARSASPGDPEAVAALLLALQQAEERETHHEAMRILEALLDLLPEGDRRWLDVFRALRWQARWVAQHRADIASAPGLEAMKRIAQVPEGRDDARLQGLVQLCKADFLAFGFGESTPAMDAAQRAVRLFEQAGDLADALLARNEMAWIRGLAGDRLGQADETKPLVEAAAAAGERYAVQEALLGWTVGASIGGRFAEAHEACGRAIAAAEAGGDAYRIAWANFLLAWLRLMEGSLGEALELLVAVKSYDPVYRETLVVEITAFARWCEGRFEDAIAEALETVAWNAGGLSRRRAWVLAVAAISAAELGRLHDAESYLERAEAGYGERPHHPFSALCNWAGGVLAWHHGRPHAALDRLDAAAAELVPQAPSFAAPVLLDQVELAAEAGEPDAVVRAAAQLTGIADRLGAGHYAALAAVASACASHLAGGDRSAGMAASQAATRFGESGHACFEARALALAGRALASVDRAEAAAQLAKAASLFDACGARWRRKRVLAALGTLGHAGARSRTSLLRPPLSRREGEVVTLALHGITAREIGQELGIGERTVETHLANAYAKLGVSSRFDLARRAGQLGLH